MELSDFLLRYTKGFGIDVLRYFLFAGGAFLIFLCVIQKHVFAFQNSTEVPGNTTLQARDWLFLFIDAPFFVCGNMCVLLPQSRLH